MNTTMPAPSRPPTPAETISRIQSCVATYYGFTVPEMLKANRTSRYATARQVGMWLTRELTAATWQDIATHYRRADHGTALHAHGVITHRLGHDQSLRRAVAEIRGALNGGPK